MTAIIVNGSRPFGGMVNSAVNNLQNAINDLHRARLAEAAAQSGADAPTGAALEGDATNFGVVASATPGDQGAAWAYALEVLDTNAQAFLAANQSSITALDNGNGV